MKLHGNARSCPASRRLMCERVDDGWTVEEAADAAGLSERSAYRWPARWRAGDGELDDRSSAPRRVANRTPKRVQDAIERLRRLRMTSTAIADAQVLARRNVEHIRQVPEKLTNARSSR